VAGEAFRSRHRHRGAGNTRGEIDEVFDGYGLLSGPDIVRLADGELAVT
jgi:hypothetical protein